MPEVLRRGPLPSLTGLRWAAAFMVFAYHVRYYAGGRAGQVTQWLAAPGRLGVSFFFVLSGFVLVWSARDGDTARRFWRRRIARIYPLHLVTAVLALALAFSVLPPMRPSGVPEVAANLLLVSAWKREWWQAVNPVSWSLTCEAFFYLCFPLVYLVVRRLTVVALRLAALGAAATVPALSVLDHLADLNLDLNAFPLFRLPEFVLGTLLARLVQLSAWRGPGLRAATVLTGATYLLTHVTPSAVGITSVTLVGFATLIPAAALADLGGRRSPWRHPVLVRLGEWSFAFYMVHVLVKRVAETALGLGRTPALPPLTAAGVALAVFGIALALSAALYQFVEMPGRRLVMRPWGTKAVLAPTPPSHPPLITEPAPPDSYDRT